MHIIHSFEIFHVSIRDKYALNAHLLKSGNLCCASPRLAALGIPLQMYKKKMEPPNDSKFFSCCADKNRPKTGLHSSKTRLVPRTVHNRVGSAVFSAIFLESYYHYYHFLSIFLTFSALCSGGSGGGSGGILPLQ